MKLADLFIKLGLKKDGFDRGIDGAKKKTNALGSALKRVGGLVAGAFAVGAIKNFISESVKAFDIQAQAENQLLVALKGRKDVQQDLIDQAKELQKTTLFGDEETIRAQALIAAFVKEEEQIKKIIPLVQDLATAKGMQLAVAADLVSKTLGSSTNALSRYGIEVEGAVGSVERLESLMLGLNSAFEGQAEAAAKVGTGPLKQLANAWGDVKEEMGKAVATGGAFVGMLESIRTSLTKTEQLMFVLNSEFATTTEKWAMALELNDKRAEKIFNSVKKRAEQETAIRNETIAQLQEIINIGDDLVDTEQETAEATKQTFEEWEKLNTSFSKGAELADATSDALSKMQKELMDSAAASDKFFEAWLKPADVSGIVGGGGVFDMVSDEEDFELPIDTEKIKRQIDEFNAIINTFKMSIATGVADIAAALGEAFASGNFDDFGSAVLQVIGGFMQQLGALMIAYALNMALFAASVSNPLSWPIALAAGVAMVAAGAAISSFASKGLGGGSASSASGYSPSASTAGTAISGNVNFVLEGDKLVGAINNNNSRRRLTR